MQYISDMGHIIKSVSYETTLYTIGVVTYVSGKHDKIPVYDNVNHPTFATDPTSG